MRKASYNDVDLQSIEIPAANGIGQVRSIAKAYSEFATGGKTLGIKPSTLNALIEPAAVPPAGAFDQVIRIDSSFSLGYMKPSPALRFGSSTGSFGTPGAGGSFGFADPDHQVGFAYAMNRMGYYLVDDPREYALRQAFYDCIGVKQYGH